VLVGLLAVLEGAVWTDSVPDGFVEKVRGRFVGEGLLDDQAGKAELRRAIFSLNQRLRHVLGEPGVTAEASQPGK
jgi:hypothetical protein